MKSLITLAAVAAISLSAARAGAQTGNGSDVTGPVGGSLSGGAFVPLPSAPGGSGGVGGTQTFPMSVVSSCNLALFDVSRVSGSIASPITRSNVTLSNSLYDLMHGQAPQAVATVSAALGAAGLPGAQSNAAVQSMANLLAAGVGNPATIVSAANAFNALVAAMTPAQLTNPPAEFLAMHAVLSPLAAALSGGAR